MSTDDPNPRPNGSSESPSDGALERYFAGRCVTAERTDIERWLNAVPDRAKVAQGILAELAAGVPPFDAARMLAATRTRIDYGERRRRSRLLRFGSSVSTRRVTLPAAALILLALGLTTYERVRPRDGRTVAAAVAARDVVAKPGQQAVVDLADGSRVVLGAGSRLRIPADFDVRGRAGARREVELQGKAHFRVEHDERRPFVVRTATAIAEDRGTEFVVRAYPENHATQVVVVSGSVAVHSSVRRGETRRAPSLERPLVVLAPGDVAELDSAGTVTLARNVNIASYLSWTTGVLTLDAARLEDALAELGRWYDVEFKVYVRGLDSLRVSGEFRTESIDVAMRRLGLMLDVGVTREGRLVVLSSRAGQ